MHTGQIAKVCANCPVFDHTRESIADYPLGIIELTHNYGTENDANFKVANGNSEPGKGFGIIPLTSHNIKINFT